MNILIKIIFIIGVISSTAVYGNQDWSSYSEVGVWEQSKVTENWLDKYSYRSLGYYAIDKEGVYYNYEKISDDIENFEVLEWGHYAKDSQNIYFFWKIVTSDIDNFEVVGYLVWKDSKYLFLGSKTLEWLDISKLKSYPDSLYWKYEWKILYFNPYSWWDSLIEWDFFIEEVDVNSFQSLGEYAKDNKNVYFRWEVLQWADAESFETIEKYWKDKNNVYENRNILSKNSSSVDNIQDINDIHKYSRYESEIENMRKEAWDFTLYILFITMVHVVIYCIVYLVVIWRERDSSLFLSAFKTQLTFNYLLLLVWVFLLWPILIKLWIFYDISIVDWERGLIIWWAVYFILVSLVTLYIYWFHKKYTKLSLIIKGIIMWLLSWWILVWGWFGIFAIAMSGVPMI